MFTTTNTNEKPQQKPENETDTIKEKAKYKNIINLNTNNSDEVNYNMIDNLLEKEKQHNKSEPWNKLDKTVKIQKLHQFAEKYGKEHGIPIKEIKSLKMFFNTSLDNNKLQKAKDVVFEKDSRDISSIPALFFNNVTHNFTLRIVDTKRVSTLKSLTPKRITAKNKEDNGDV
jgi:hypothetical protein